MFPHVERIDLKNDGTSYEVLVMQKAPNGDLYFIRILDLDEIDKKRMRTILSKRDAAKYALWDLLDQTTLPNGVNALVFFQQFVKVRSLSGEIFSPGSGRMGMGPAPQVPQQQAAATGKHKKDDSPKG